MPLPQGDETEDLEAEARRGGVHLGVVTADDTNALEATYSTGHGKLRFNVAMPRDVPPVGGPPDGSGSGHFESWLASRC